jgi:hypothetical protein
MGAAVCTSDNDPLALRDRVERRQPRAGKLILISPNTVRTPAGPTFLP